MSYRDSLDGELQVSTEEMIAAMIFDHPDVETSEGHAVDLGRTILHAVLERFRPDLVEGGGDLVALAAGNPFDGLELYGPFFTPDKANKFGDDLPDGDYWGVRLRAPE